MKKHWQSLLLAATAVFLAFTAGVYLGRNHSRGGVSVQVPAAMHSAPTAPSETASPTTQTISYPIDINTASAEELETLPGIGRVLARRIEAFREENGRFSRLEELMQVEGIGEKRMEELLEYIWIGE